MRLLVEEDVPVVKKKLHRPSLFHPPPPRRPLGQLAGVSQALLQMIASFTQNAGVIGDPVDEASDGVAQEMLPPLHQAQILPVVLLMSLLVLRHS